MKRIVCWTLLFVCSCIATAQSQSIDILLNHAQTRSANVGVYIQNLRTGEVIDSYRENNLIPPASVIKVLTTATALEILGSEYRFPTMLEYSGVIEHGVLRGNLYIHGYGDPTLGSTSQAFLQTWVKAIVAAGIYEIDGAVIGDVSYFDGDAMNPGWLWEDIANYYAPGIYAIAYMDNTMNIVLQSGHVGQIARVISTQPVVPGIQFENHIRCTETTEDGAFVHGLPYQNIRYLTGSVPSSRGSFGVRGDIPNPALLLAQHLTTALKKAGISVTKEAAYIAENDLTHRTRLYEHLSKPLREIVKKTNMRSVNLYAEMIFRVLGARLSVPGSIHNSDLAVHSYWHNRAVDIQSAILKDGCGLAPQDGISAKSLVQLFAYMNHSTEHEAFYQSLPVSGQSGTLKGMLAGTALEGRVHAKSGTIAGTKNFAGYIEMPNGDRWAFAVMVNSAQGKARTIQPIIEQYLLDVYRKHK